MIKILSSITGLILSCAVCAEEHPACRDIDFTYHTLTSKTLRTIASSCTDDAIADLYYRRARHAELVADHAVMSQLNQVRKTRDDWTVDQNLLFLSLVEVFTAQQNLPDSERAEVLNTALEHTIDIAELRLKGYDNRARQLEMKGIGSRTPPNGDTGTVTR